MPPAAELPEDELEELLEEPLEVVGVSVAEALEEELPEVELLPAELLLAPERLTTR